MDNHSSTCHVNNVQDSSNLIDLMHNLRERIKELNCLYGISKIVESGNISLSGILKEAVELISSAWQYPEVACARIKLKNHSFVTTNYRETIWKQAETIIVNGKPYGKVEIFYLEEKATNILTYGTYVCNMGFYIML
ncbi:hypothetical protein ACFLXL_01950 [Chloroflexota bacterium]